MIFGKSHDRGGIDAALQARVDAQAAHLDAMGEELLALRAVLGALARELLAAGRLDPAQHPWAELLAVADQPDRSALGPLRAAFMAPVAAAPPEEPGLRVACPACQTLVSAPAGGSARCWYCGTDVVAPA